MHGSTSSDAEVNSDAQKIRLKYMLVFFKILPGWLLCDFAATDEYVCPSGTTSNLGECGSNVGSIVVKVKD